jgi:hypothetical protein
MNKPSKGGGLSPAFFCGCFLIIKAVCERRIETITAAKQMSGNGI